METGTDGGEQTPGRRGSVGRQTYDSVRALLDQGLSRSDAFARVGEETGRSPGTVATAFYRVARQEPDGGGVRQRPRKRAGTSTPARAAGGGGRRAASPEPSVDRLVADVHRSIDHLAAQLRTLETEVRTLREQAGRYEQVRKLFADR